MSAPTIVTGKCARFTDGCCARLVTLPAGWTTVRVGVANMSQNAAIAGNPRMGLGLCDGTTNILGDATTDKFIGMISQAGLASWVLAGLGHNIPVSGGIKVGTNWTYTVADPVGTIVWGYGARPAVCFADITRSGNTSFSFTFWYRDTWPTGYSQALLNNLMVPYDLTGNGCTKVGPSTISYPSGFDLMSPAFAFWWSPAVYADLLTVAVGIVE